MWLIISGHHFVVCSKFPLDQFSYDAIRCTAFPIGTAKSAAYQFHSAAKQGSVLKQRNLETSTAVEHLIHLIY